jgi:hypothetical protein
MRVATLAMAALFLAASRIPARGQPIEAAVLPLPEVLRGAAQVVRLDDASRPETLRAGTNGMVCIADEPGDEVFDVRCYQAAFIPVVYRAFQLGYAVAGPKVEEEIKAGQLALSPDPSAGYRCLGPAQGYDSVTNSISSEIECWQSIHFPFRTAREIGLPEQGELPAGVLRTMPYVMGSGGYWSHVMIRHPPR